nr:hypothetical protein [Deltaproteobacteria bacterium]
MIALLDTHALIWWVSGDKRLPRSHRRVIKLPRRPGRSPHRRDGPVMGATLLTVDGRIVDAKLVPTLS